MASQIQQKTIPTLYNMSSSQALVCLWALEEVSPTHSIKYHVKNLPRRDPNTPILLRSLFPVNKSPIMTLSPADTSPEAQTAASTIYQITPGVLTESEWITQSPEDKRRDAFFSEFAKASLALKVFYCVLLESLASFLPFGIRHLVLLLIRPVVKHFVKDQEAIYGVMEGALSEEKKWFSGEQMGLADFGVCFPLDMAVTRGYFNKRKFPKVMGWYERVVGREAYKRALEKGGVYDVKTFA